MLTITKNTDANNNVVSLTVAGIAITEFIAAQPSPTFTISLITNYNCAEDITVSLAIGDLNQVDETYTILPSVYGQDTKLSDGVYYVEILKTPNAGSPSQETDCVLIDVDLTCSVLTHVANDLTSNIVYYLDALKLVEDCDDCTCSKACILYNKIQRILKSESNDNNCTSC